MGTGASAVPPQGVPINPRVEYTDQLVKDVKKSLVIDAPVLVDLGHGTVRYRYVRDKLGEGKRIEKPHEGPERRKKHGYFYHAKLNDFSEDGSHTKEDDFKFRYVFKGPQKAKQKRLHFVVGTPKGLRNQAGSEIRNKPTGKGYKWPAVYKKTNHAYYELTIIDQEVELSDDEEEAVLEEPSETEHTFNLKVKSSDTIESLQGRLSVCLLKEPDHIHIIHESKELGKDDIIEELISGDDVSPARVLVQLSTL